MNSSTTTDVGLVPEDPRIQEAEGPETPRGPARLAWDRFRAYRLGMFGLTVVAVLFILSIVLLLWVQSGWLCLGGLL